MLRMLALEKFKEQSCTPRKLLYRLQFRATATSAWIFTSNCRPLPHYRSHVFMGNHSP